jgi:Cysteine rich repeat
MTVRVLVKALALVLLIPAASAAERPCREDVARFCRGVAPRGGHLIRCLQRHAAELSPACRAAAQSFEERLARHQPCLRDRERLCRSMPAGEGRMMHCLRAHREELSSSCRAAIGVHADYPPSRAGASSRH